METKYINKKNLINAIYILLTLLIVGLWFFMHIHQIEEIPIGLNVDEAGMAYDAFCVLNWGVDRYLNPYPLYFLNNGGGMSAMYVYLCAFCIKFLGTRTLAFRIPAIIFSAVTMIFSSLIVKKMWGKNWAFINAILFCFLPYFTCQSRFGLDCNIMLGAGTFCVYMTIIALEKNNKWFYCVSGLCWGIALYTYVLSYIVFSLFLFLILLVQIKRKNYKPMLMIPPMVIISIPLIAMVIINVFKIETITTKFFTIYRLTLDRVDEFGGSSLFQLFFANLKRIFTYDGFPGSAFPEYYTLYPLSIPICAIGYFSSLYYLFIKKYDETKKNIVYIMHFYTLAMMVLMFARENTIYNLNAIFLPLLFWIINGIYAIMELVTKVVFKEKFKFIPIGIIMAGYLYYFAGFANFYFNVFPTISL